MTFTDNGNGTATLAGTPAVGTGGHLPDHHHRHQRGGSPNATQSFTLTVDAGARPSPAAPHTTFTVGTAGSFTVTTTGNPTAGAVTRPAPCPPGVTFVDNGNGTATLAGTPAAGTGGTYPITITATNGVAPERHPVASP